MSFKLAEKKVKFVSFFHLPLLFLALLSISTLSGCADSLVSRGAGADINGTIDGARNLVSDGSEGSLAQAYGNSSQTTKGALIGGTAGAITGALSSGIGILPGAATGAVIGGGYGSYIDRRTLLCDRLSNRGVTTVVLGDQILMVIPSNAIFGYQSAHVTPQGFDTLAMATRYINMDYKMLVKVSAYTDRGSSRRIDLALSQQQAENVARALTANGVDARVLYAVGYGGANLVGRNTLDWDTSDNNRIEITWEKLYV